MVILKLNNISQYYCFYCIFDQINAALVDIKLTSFKIMKKFEKDM